MHCKHMLLHSRASNCMRARKKERESKRGIWNINCPNAGEKLFSLGVAVYKEAVFTASSLNDSIQNLGGQMPWVLVNKQPVKMINKQPEKKKVMEDQK